MLRNKKDFQKFDYEIVADYVLNNHCSPKEACVALDLDSNRFNSLIRHYKITDIAKYNKLKEILEMNKYRDTKSYIVVLHIIETKASPHEAAKYFEVTPHLIKKHVQIIESARPDLYKRIIDIWSKIQPVVKTAKPIEVANYILTNNASEDQVCSHFEFKFGSLQQYLAALRKLDEIKYYEVKAVLNSHKKPERNMIHGVPKYLQVANYIIENKKSLEQAADYFNISGNLVNTFIYFMLKKYEPSLFNQVKTTLKSIPRYLKCEKVAHHILDNNLTIEQGRELYGLDVVDFNRLIIQELRTTNYPLYLSMKEIMQENRKYVLIADFVIENNASVEDIMVKFGMNRNLTLATIHSIKKANPELHEEVLRHLQPYPKRKRKLA
jgi:hypothetical protein